MGMGGEIDLDLRQGNSKKTVDKPGCLAQKTIFLNNTDYESLKIYNVTNPVAGKEYLHYAVFRHVVMICH
jgi:hypothetical protein